MTTRGLALFAAIFAVAFAWRAGCRWYRLRRAGV